MNRTSVDQRRLWRDFDFVLLIAVIALVVTGIVMIRSATANSPGLVGTAQRQLLYSIAGFALLLALTLIDYRALSALQKPLYILLVLLLLGVDAIGFAAGGAKSWINLGLFPMQPSELAKVLMILILARYLAAREGRMGNFLNVLLAFLILVPPVVLIYLQPDLGTAVVLLVIGGVMILLSGMRLLHITILGTIGLIALPAIWLSLEEYMRARVLLFLHPDTDPDAIYNVNQALISIGSGGWLGKGYGQGTQSQLHFLRVRHTDFIFSVVAEELGFVGALLLMLALLLVLLRLIRIAERARDPLGRSIAVGVATMIFFQTVVSIGMNLNLMPVTGIPLPLVSYGGSSLLTMLMGIGLAESVALRQRKIDF